MTIYALKIYEKKLLQMRHNLWNSLVYTNGKNGAGLRVKKRLGSILSRINWLTKLNFFKLCLGLNNLWPISQWIFHFWNVTVTVTKLLNRFLSPNQNRLTVFKIFLTESTNLSLSKLITRTFIKDLKGLEKRCQRFGNERFTVKSFLSIFGTKIGLFQTHSISFL